MELFYKKFGSGSPLIILHGLYGSSDNWTGIAKKLADIFEVFLVDLRNHGRSPHSEQHSYQLIRDDLYRFMDSNGIDKASILGHSMGGKAAVCFALSFPERVERIIIVDIAPKSYIKLSKESGHSHKKILEALKSVDLSLVSSRREVDQILSETIPHKHIRGFLLKNLKRDNKNNFYWLLNIDALLEEIDSIIDGVSSECFSRRSDTDGLPALFIRGENSAYVSDDDMEDIVSIFPGSHLVTIPGAGHWLHAEKPEEFLEAVRSFVLQ